LNIGTGEEPDVQVGPLINQAQFEKVTTLVQDAVSKGAKVLVGGKGAPQHGRLFYEPTVLTDIKDDMRVYSEEVFGPVVNIFRFDSEEESVAMANNTERGLAGYFYSRDVSQIFRVARKLEVGMCGVNEGMISTAEAPFGGVKESGLGREGSHHGIEEFTYVKYVALGNL
jgi:succinate-semialdehyde dehydrogenase